MSKSQRLPKLANTTSKSDYRFPKAPWDVMGCFKAPGVSLGGSGVSIGGVRILRVVCFFQKMAGPIIL